MTERTWHKGPPPHVGWWLTLAPYGYKNEWRWWNGSYWSAPVLVHSESEAASARSKIKAFLSVRDIRWSDYWPETARVPRLDPTDGDWTFNTDGKKPDIDEPIDVVFRDGSRTKSRFAFGFYWGVFGDDYDIVAWRPAK